MVMANAIDVAGHKLGPGFPCFVIAEAGINHNGDPELARRLVDVAVEARADAVKFQTFVAELVTTPAAPKAAYQAEATGAGESQLEMIRKFELPFTAFRELSAYCQRRGILFLSTPFDHDSANFLDELGVPAFKVPSGEVTNHPFLAYVAHKGKPMILSTGMATLAEVDEAVGVIRRAGEPPLALLQCVSNYPAAPADVNLRAMHTLQTAFGVPVGYSDHTPGAAVALAAVALGACVIEKHFTLDKGLAGPDHQASLDPGELADLVRSIRTVEAALGDGRKVPAAAEEDTRQVARRSLVLARDLAEGEQIAAAALVALRPAGGIPPNLCALVVGRRAARWMARGTTLSWQDLR
jgi:N,N'-diacetyllegionaminate synthase